jgi:hypothetical protein
MKERKIFVFCDGGLGNRLNSLIGGLVIAESYNLKPIICWPENNWCGCSFEDLFDNQFDTIKEDVFYFFKEESENLFLSITDNGIKLKNYLEPNDHGFESIKQINSDVVYYHNKIPKNLNQDKVKKFVSFLKVKESILKIVRRFIKENAIDKRTKGIHIRKTDSSNQLDSHQLFENIKNDRNTRYFVCSDDEETEDMFSKLNNVSVFKKTSYVQKLNDGEWRQPTKDTSGRIFDFNIDRPKQSVIEAFVDLLILSKTNISVKNKSTFLSWAHLYSSSNF